MEKISNFIRAKRIALGMNQREFSEHIFGDGTKNRWISAIERGRPITVITLFRILDKLNTEFELIEH